MKKKILSLLTLLGMLVALLPTNVKVFAETTSGTCGDNLTWTLNDSGTLTISGTGDMTNYNYGNYSNVPWYSSRDTIKTVIIECGVTNIGNYAFYHCESLTSVTIPNSVTSIDAYAFYYCKSLRSVTIPDSVTSIGYDAFENSGLASVTIPNSVIYIGSYAFSCCYLTSVTIPNSVTYIGSSAFFSSDLKSITIGNGVTGIGSGAFENTDYYNNNSNWENGVLYIGDYLIEAKFTITSCNIKSGTKLIADYAFANCSSLTSVTISNSVTGIGEYAFKDCDKLTSISIPNGVTSIGSYAFNYCKKLSSIYISESVTSIGEKAFWYCDNISTINVSQGNTHFISENNVLFSKDKSVLVLYSNKKTNNNYSIPDTVTSIASGAFYFSANLTNVNISSSVSIIGSHAFSDCINLTDVYISHGIKTIDWAAFAWCNSLKNVHYNGTQDDWNAISIDIGNNELNDATNHYFAYVKLLDENGNEISNITQNMGEYVNTSSIAIPNGYALKLYKNKELTEEYSIDTPISENLNLYYDIIELNKLKITGTESADIEQKGITESVTFATNKTAKDFVATIKYSDKLNLSTITEKDFTITENLSETKDGYTYLYLTCTYKNDGNMPKNTTLNPFDLAFDVSESATANEKLTIEFVGDETFLADNDSKTYDFDGLGTAEIKVNPMFVKSITINGADEIDTAMQYTAVISPENATNKDIEWSVDNSEIATISADGILTPVKAGTVKITATAKDGSSISREKSVNIKVYAQITSLTASAGEWDKTFAPSEREYIIYVPKNTSSIKLTPTHNGTLLKGTTKCYSGRNTIITLTDKETVLTLTYSQTGYTDSEYKIKIVKFEGTKTTVSEDGKAFTVKPINVDKGNTVILALYDGDTFVEMQSAIYDGEDIPFTTTESYRNAKVMVWNSIGSMTPICEAEIVK